MKLITEHIEEVEIITEARADGKQDHYIKGIFLQADITNRNGRQYPFNVMEREVKRYNDQYVKQGRAVGELGHPDGPTVNLDRVSHKIVELVPEGTNFIGKAKLLETPMGNIAKSLLKEGVKLGVSSRGVGTIEEKNGVKYVKDDFMLATAADIVADPSAPDAFVQGIMEGVEWIWDNGLLKEVKVQQIKNYVSESTRFDMESRKLKAFEYFLRSL
jgi:Prohead core protein serine protease